MPEPLASPGAVDLGDVGGHGEHVTEPGEIRGALEKAFASGRPALVNVEIRQDRGQPKGSTYV